MSEVCYVCGIRVGFCSVAGDRYVSCAFSMFCRDVVRTTFVFRFGIEQWRYRWSQTCTTGRIRTWSNATSCPWQMWSRRGVRHLPNQRKNKCVEMLHLPLNCSTAMSLTATATSVFCTHPSFFISSDNSCSFVTDGCHVGCVQGVEGLKNPKTKEVQNTLLVSECMSYVIYTHEKKIGASERKIEN